MIHLTPSPGVTLLLVEVSQNWRFRKIRNEILEYEIFPLRAIYSDALPPGSWQFIATTDKMSEEQAETIVDQRFNVDYDKVLYAFYYDSYKDFATDSALVSLRSCIISGGGEPGKTYAILKQTI